MPDRQLEYPELPSRNVDYFSNENRARTFLRARGWSDSGRCGGIVPHPKEPVTLPAWSVVGRFYQPGRRYGDWWWTPFELSEIASYFARGVTSKPEQGSGFGTGRREGNGILHATFAVRFEWGGYRPSHMSRFHAVRLKARLLAFFGEGDVADSSGFAEVLKPARIVDSLGRQRLVRQLFIPGMEQEAAQGDVVLERDGATDRNLLPWLAKVSPLPLPFER